MLGFVVAGALLSTLILTVMVRKWPSEFRFTLVAFLCIAGTQVVFWAFTFPANQLTSNWTVLPENRLALRTQWEYSHASTVLNLIALIALIFSVVLKK